MLTTATAHTWDRAAGRYRDPGGRFVPDRDIRSAVDAVSAGAGEDLVGLARRLNAGEIDLARWERESRGLIRATHVMAAAAAKGGRARLTAEDLGRAGGRIRREYEHLYEFAREIDRGGLSPAKIEARARMYGLAGTRSYEAVRRGEMAALGFTQEKRELNASVSCPECATYAARGWVAIGTLPGTGERCSCRGRCQCSFRYRGKGKARPDQAADLAQLPPELPGDSTATPDTRDPHPEHPNVPADFGNAHRLVPKLDHAAGDRLARKMADWQDGDRMVREIADLDRPGSKIAKTRASLADGERLLAEFRGQLERAETVEQIREATDLIPKFRARVERDRAAYSAAVRESDADLHRILGVKAEDRATWEHDVGKGKPWLADRQSEAADYLEPMIARRPGPNGKTPRLRVGWRGRPDGDREGYDDERRHIGITPSTESAVAVHEWGHAIEQQIPGASEAARAFLAKRVGPELISRLGDVIPDRGYGPYEFGWRDEFGKHFPGPRAYYAGKVYPGGETEVISMGLEAMHRDPARFAREDPEYAKFILFVLRGPSL